MLNLSNPKFLFGSASEYFRVIEVINKEVKSHSVKRVKSSKEFELIKISSEADIILSLDHATVTSVTLPVIVTRPDSSQPIAESELENLLSQAIWKLFNQERGRAAQKMQCPDVGVALSDAEVLSIKLDGHRSLNPVGFNARTVEFCLRAALVNSARFEKITSELPAEQIIAVYECPLTGADLISRRDFKTPFLYISVDYGETVLYRYQNQTLTYLDSLSWGSRDILRAISQLFLVDEEPARLVLEKYLCDRAGALLRRRLEKALSAELAMLLKAIDAHRETESKEKVYIHSFFDISGLVFESRFIKKLKMAVSLVSVDEQFISQISGFALKLNVPTSREHLASLMAALVLASQKSDYDAVSKIAKRRVRWMSGLAGESLSRSRTDTP